MSVSLQKPNINHSETTGNLATELSDKAVIRQQIRPIYRPQAAILLNL